MSQTLSDDVARALESLPADFRTAVVLCDVESFSYKEIAEIMECPVGTVMSRLYRGRRLLKQALRDFAIQQGIIKGQESDAGGAPAETIDLAAYRNQRTKQV